MSAAALETIALRLEPRAAIGAGAALLALTLLAGALYGIKPAWLEYRTLAQQHERALRESSGRAADSSAIAIAAAERDLAALRAPLDGGASQVPRRQIESFVVDSLDRLSVAHHVQLRGVTPEEPGRVLMFEELPYEVQVTGPYFALHRWLHAVEEELRPMVVKQFSMTPENGEGASLSLRLVAYRPTAEGGAS